MTYQAFSLYPFSIGTRQQDPHYSIIQEVVWERRMLHATVGLGNRVDTTRMERMAFAKPKYS
jgi:hypothetical protein